MEVSTCLLFASLPVKSQTPFPSLSVVKTKEGSSFTIGSIHECVTDNTIKHFLKLYNHGI